MLGGDVEYVDGMAMKGLYAADMVFTTPLMIKDGMGGTILCGVYSQ